MSLTLSQIWKACQEVAAEEKVSPLGKVSVGALPEGATVKELNVCPAVDCAKAKALGLPADVDSAPPLSSSNPCRPQGPSHTRRAQAEEESAPHAHPRQPQLLRTSVPPAARRSQGDYPRLREDTPAAGRGARQEARQDCLSAASNLLGVGFRDSV